MNQAVDRPFGDLTIAQAKSGQPAENEPTFNH